MSETTRHLAPAEYLARFCRGIAAGGKRRSASSGRLGRSRAGGAVGAGPVHATAQCSMSSAMSPRAVKPASFVKSSLVRVRTWEDAARSFPPGATNKPSGSCGGHEAERICRGEPR